MKTAEQILENTHSFLDDTMGRCYERVEVLAAMNEYALQFIHPTKCWACNGDGKFAELGNMTCQNCKGAGKVILLPTITNTGT